MSIPQNTARLLILHTGGTIGMVPSPQGYVPTAGFSDRLAAHLACYADHPLPDYQLIEMSPLIDSADLVPSDWQRVMSQLRQHWDHYDGFVILHGTDTLAYTASALSFMLGAMDKPVVLTGSQIPLGEPRSDALNNLQMAMLTASREDAPREVSIAFHDRILRGNRARKVRSQGLDAFNSPNAPWLGESGITLRFLPQALTIEAPVWTDMDFERHRVALLTTFPGMTLDPLNALLDDPRLSGLVLYSYGVGNPPSLNGQLVARLKQATEQGVTILNVTQCHQGQVEQGAYATGATLNEAGVIPGHDITLEAALSKLQVLLAQGLSGEALRQALMTPLRGEFSL